MKNTILQLGTASLVIGGFVVLTLKGSDTTAYVGLVMPILGAVFVVQQLNHRSDKQDEKLDKITHQTNGVLTERINGAVADGVKQALAEREGPGT
jgi:uncharacterized membrane protein HdeD (DUF308 family)